MQFYDHIESIINAVIRFMAGDTLARVREQAPDQLAALVNSDAVTRGISLAQAAAALLSALFAFILMTAILRKRQLSAPGETAPVQPETAAETVAAPSSAGVLRPRWDQVRAHLDSSREADWKVAVMEADKIVDDALAKTGFPGNSFGDRLTNIQPGTLLSLDGLWWAHKIRNRLAHEMDYFLRYTEARQAFGYYEQALNELQLL